MNNFYYSIEGPSLYENSGRIPRWGLNATISKSFANTSIHQKRTERIEEILEGDANLTLQKGKFPDIRIFGKQRIYHFFEDTCLVRAVQVPGSACDLALDESALHEIARFGERGQVESDLSYMPHNIDSFAQGIFLEVLFRKWTNHFVYLLT